MSLPKVLIADDDRDLVRVLAERCKALGLSVIRAHEGIATINAIRTHEPDLACIDLQMPAGNGLSICEMMAEDPSWSSIPVILLTGNAEPKTIMRCHDMCVYYVQKCPSVWERIEPMLYELLDIEPRATASVGSDNEELRDEDEPSSDTELLEAVFAMLGTQSDVAKVAEALQLPEESTPGGQATDPEDSRPWILHIEDDEDFSSAMSIRLRPYGVSVVRAFTGMEGYRRAFTQPANVIILDMELPNGQGDYVLRRLKETPATRDIPVIILTGRRERALERRLMNLGADGFLTKPLDFEALLAKLRRFIELCNDSGDGESGVVRSHDLVGSTTG